MQLTPAQLGMALLLRGRLPSLRYGTDAEGIARGRQMLVGITGMDIGYNLIAWHEHLSESNEGGYKRSNKHRGFSKAIAAATNDSNWRCAVLVAERDSLFEQLNDRDARQRVAIEDGETKWANANRTCPNCQTEFRSVGNRGQCPACSKVFYASNPDSGSSMWWHDVK